MAQRRHESGSPREVEDAQGEPDVDLAFDDSDGDAPLELDRKDLLIVKDGTIRVAESLDAQPSDARGDGAKASGTWTKAEHDRFLKAMELYPKGPWKAIAEMVGSRTVRQTQTHAQKYREKMARRMRGLRNRNGTLQRPPSAAAAAGMQVYALPPMPVPPGAYYQPPAGLLHPVAYPPAISPSSQHELQVSVQMPPLVLRPTAEFAELSQSSISSAFLGNAAYPTSWGSGAAEGKEEVPGFDESMDFLMDMYSADPNQIGVLLPPSAAPSMLSASTVPFPPVPSSLSSPTTAARVQGDHPQLRRATSDRSKHKM